MKPETIHKFIEETNASAQKAKESDQKPRYEKLKNVVRNAKMALMETGMDPEKISVAKLPEDILGQEQGGEITIDEVVFKDYETLVHTLRHEQLHTEGIDNDGLIEAIISRNRKKTPFYEEEVKKVQKITEIIGIDFAKELYRSEQYTELFARFKKLHAKKFPEEKNAEEIFFEGFPELTISGTNKKE